MAFIAPAPFVCRCSPGVRRISGRRPLYPCAGCAPRRTACRPAGSRCGGCRQPGRHAAAVPPRRQTPAHHVPGGPQVRAALRKAGICLVRQNVRKSRSGSASRRGAQHDGRASTAVIVSSPAGRARASSPASLAMRWSTAATRARPAARLAVPGQSPPGRRCGSRSPRRGPGPAPMPVPVRPAPAAMPPAKPGSGLAAPAGLPPACPDPPVDRRPPIVLAVFRKPDAVAVLTARLLPATLGPGWLCP
jgi:hypothetical protein